jgi:hypothetical protein
MKLNRILIIISCLSYLFISFVYPATYRIDYTEDGIPDQIITTDDLQWKFYLQSFGAESGGNLPQLSVDGNPELIISKIPFNLPG